MEQVVYMEVEWNGESLNNVLQWGQGEGQNY